MKPLNLLLLVLLVGGCGNSCLKQGVCLSLHEIEREKRNLQHEKKMFDIDRRHLCPDQKVYIKDNDMVRIIEYECNNHKNEADGKCRFCCIDEKTSDKNIINQICFDCEIYGAIVTLSAVGIK